MGKYGTIKYSRDGDILEIKFSKDRKLIYCIHTILPDFTEKN